MPQEAGSLDRTIAPTARCQHHYTSASIDQCPLRALPGGRVCRQHLAARDHPLRECLAVFDVNAAWTGS